jgi:toxin ParE1/3/4
MPSSEKKYVGMSPPDRPLILSPQAIEDFTDLLQYTLATWGEAQLHAYRGVLDQALTTIQNHPDIGHARPDLSSKHQVFPAGRHIIIYQITETGILVSRILHERMDVQRHF